MTGWSTLHNQSSVETATKVGKLARGRGSAEKVALQGDETADSLLKSRNVGLQAE
jgi:hypothetical protein